MEGNEGTVNMIHVGPPPPPDVDDEPPSGRLFSSGAPVSQTEQAIIERAGNLSRIGKQKAVAKAVCGHGSYPRDETLIPTIRRLFPDLKEEIPDIEPTCEPLYVTPGQAKKVLHTNAGRASSSVGFL